MATSAVAQAAVFALRQKIAKIEGRLSERLTTPVGGSVEETMLRHGGLPTRRGIDGLLRTGVASLDSALGGGLPRAALTELHGSAIRDAGAVAGFALALGSLLKPDEASNRGPMLWIGASQAFAEAGFPYAPGLASFCGLSPGALLIAQPPRLVDALWIAEEAARLTEFSAVILEIDGNPAQLDLTATRRLHRRAMQADRPVFLLRQAAEPEPTAAPIRLILSAAPATPRDGLAGPLADSIGHPAFTVTVSKSRMALPGQFILEWNPHERAFQERRPANPRIVVPAPSLRPDLPAAAGAVVAFEPARKADAARRQPPGKQHPARHGTRRTG